MVKKCPKCGNENFDFKIFCGFCGEALESPSSMKNSDMVSQVDFQSKEMNYRPRSPTEELRESSGVTIILIALPILLTIMAFPIILDLWESGLVSIALIYGNMIIFILELIFLAGSFVIGDDLRIGRISFPIRFVMALMLFFSIASIVILYSLGAFGQIPSWSAWGEALLVFIAVFWLLFLGPLREEKIKIPGQ